MMMKLIISLIVLLSIIDYSDSCGFTTHNVVAHRTANYYFKSKINKYNTIVKNNINTLLAGSPFPDYLFQCGKVHDNGEYAHTDNFQINATNYIRSLPKPWTEDTEKLVAFMLGVTSHSEADTIWHGLTWGSYHYVDHYGFIETLGYSNYGCHGLCWRAHIAADTGGEFVAAYQTDLSWFKPSKWYVPTKHLVKIFALGGRQVDPFSIDECHLEFTTGAIAIKDFGFLLFKNETRHSPAMVEFYENLPLGGINDMAVWSARYWNRLIDWIENGPPIINEKNKKKSMHIEYGKLVKLLGKLYIEHINFKDLLHKQDVTKLRQYLKDLMYSNRKPQTSNEILLMKWLNEYMDFNGAKVSSLSIPSKQKISTPQTLNSNKQIVTNEVLGSKPLAYLGNEIVIGDFDNNGQDDMVMSSHGQSKPGLPQFGSISVRYNNNKDVMQTINCSQVFSRFGSAMTVLDFNHDNIDDLVVGAPTYGWNWNETLTGFIPKYNYFGQIMIYFGSENGLSDTPDILIQNNDTKLLMIGTKLFSGDIDGDGHNDLLIGSPYSRGGTAEGVQRGSVYGILSKSSYETGMNININDADLILQETNNYSWFGYEIKIINDTFHGRLLLIGAPLFHSTPKIAVGQLYAYSLINYKSPSVAFTILGTSESGKLGYSFDYGAPLGNNEQYLALGIPTADTNQWSGEVILFSLQDLKGNLKLNDIKPLTVFKANAYGARFGYKIQFYTNILNNENCDDLFIAAPLYTSIFERGYETGRVIGFKGANTFKTGVITDAESQGDVIYNGHNKHGRFGTSFVISSKNSIITISEPHASNNNIEMSGGVLEFKI